MNKGFPINNIRGDLDPAFGNTLCNWLDDPRRNIKNYFTEYQFTNRNRVVDRVMRTIRDIFNQLGANDKELLCNIKLMEKVVERYNNTPHRAFDNKFTPNQVQHNHQLEAFYIRTQKMKLEEVNHLQYKFKNYKPGNILLVHIPFKDINYKRRRNFTHLAEFINYEFGNVKCNVLYPEPLNIITLPIYYTQLVARDIHIAHNLPNLHRYFYSYFLNSK
jgi:hypothetical protein